VGWHSGMGGRVHGACHNAICGIVVAWWHGLPSLRENCEYGHVLGYCIPYSDALE
jgi:hypothetical protein